MFKHMEIAESICEGVVEPYYKKPTQADASRSGHISNKIGESVLSNTCPAMGESADKC